MLGIVRDAVDVVGFAGRAGAEAFDLDLAPPPCPLQALGAGAAVFGGVVGGVVVAVPGHGSGCDAAVAGDEPGAGQACGVAGELRGPRLGVGTAEEYGDGG